jgi:hypothetical protein
VRIAFLRRQIGVRVAAYHFAGAPVLDHDERVAELARSKAASSSLSLDPLPFSPDPQLDRCLQEIGSSCDVAR